MAQINYIDIYSPTKKGWYGLTPPEKAEQVRELEYETYSLPPIPKSQKKKPLMDMLSFLMATLNIPSAAISGAAYQLLDKKPGFNTSEYFRWVFGKRFRDQGSWSDVIQMLAEREPTKNMWDSKVAQILVGLALDIILDPTTYIGTGLLKEALPARKVSQLSRVAKKIFDAEVIAKGGISPEKGKVVAKEISKLAAGQKLGFKLPFSKFVSVPFTKTAKPVEEAIEAGGRIGLKQFYSMYEIAKKRALRGVIARVDDFIANLPKVGPAYKWTKKAFFPGTLAYEEVIQAGIARQTKIMQSSNDLAAVMDKLNKVLPYDAQVAARQYLQNVNGIAYKDGKLVEATANKARLVTEMIRKLDKEELSSEEFLQALIKYNSKYKEILTDEVVDIIRNFKDKTGVYKELPVHDLVRANAHVYDELSIRQLQSALVELGYKYDPKLTTMAGFKLDPYRVRFTEVKAFRKHFANMSDEQKELINGLVDQIRILHMKWNDLELQHGITHRFIRNYMAGYKGVFEGAELPMEIGAQKSWFQFHKWAKNTDRVKNSIARIMVRTGYVPTKEPTAKMIAKHGLEEAKRIVHKEAVEKAKQLLIKGDPYFGKIFDTITEAAYARGLAHSKAMARKQLIEQLKQYGTKIDIKDKKIFGYVDIGERIPELKGWLFSTDDAKYITRTINVLNGDEQIGKFLRSIDKITSWWKVLATSVNPGFHFRNMYSNHFLGWVYQGIQYFNPNHHKLSTYVAWKMLYDKEAAVRRALGLEAIKDDVLDKLFANGKTLRELSDFAYKRGLLREEFRMLETARYKGIERIQKGIGRALKKISPLSTQSFQADIGEKIASLIENESRFAAFLTEFKRLGDMETALRNIENVFVSYRRITPFEREVVRTIVPFWTWMKQNTLNQLRFVFTQPGRYSKIPKIANAISAGIDKKVPEELQPAYYKDLWMWQLPIMLPNGTPLFFNPNLPFQDLNRLPVDVTQPVQAIAEFAKDALSAVSPFLKTFIEIIPGYDVFRKRPLERYPGYKAPVPGILQPLAQFWTERFPETAEKFGLEYENGVVTMNPKAARAIENFLPFINNYARLLWTSPTKENYENIFQFISYTVGIKIKPLDLLEQKRYYLLNELRERKKYWEEKGL